MRRILGSRRREVSNFLLIKITFRLSAS